MRDSRLDIIRSMAILLVVLVHTWSLAGADGQYPLLNGLYGALDGCGVPLFLMISGALSLGKVDDYATFYRKRYVRLLIPFLIWSAVIYVLSALTGKYPEVQTWQDGLRMYVPFLVTNRINWAYWFVPLMVVLYALTPFLQRLLNDSSERATVGILLVGLALLTIRSVWPQFYLLTYTSPLLYYLWMYLAGYYIYHFAQQRKWMRPIVLLPVLLACFALYAMGVLGSNLWRCLLCASLFSLMLRLPATANGLTGRFFRSVSDSSYAIYLFHMALISPLYKLIDFAGANAPLWQAALYPLVAALVVWLFCAAVCRLAKAFLPHHHIIGIV